MPDMQSEVNSKLRPENLSNLNWDLGTNFLGLVMSTAWAAEM